MTTSEIESSSKVLATHRYRSAVVYVRQSTPGQVEHNTERVDSSEMRAWGSSLTHEGMRASARLRDRLRLCR